MGDDGCLDRYHYSMDQQLQALQVAAQQAADHLHIADLTRQHNDMQQASQQPDFWQDSQQAQNTMRQIAKLNTRTQPWNELLQDVGDAMELMALRDATMQTELQQQIDTLQTVFDQLKDDLKFAGPYDDHDALLTLSAGAGGTDAQDWTGMLLRMYGRYCDQSDFTYELLDESAGEEAGIKSATLRVSGSFAYGKLKAEQGVHRLVRLSPFNSDNLRQTSFAKVEVAPVIDKPDDIAIDDKDLKIDVYRAGGHGGQSVNTTDSAVRITHLPTGLVVAIQNERSQLQNRETALSILRSRLAQLQVEQHAEHLADLKGPNQSAEWGNQIRSYVLHPYKQVKDLRTRHETSDPDAVLDGALEPFIQAYLEQNL